jgi:hypothetical protein
MIGSLFAKYVRFSASAFPGSFIGHGVFVLPGSADTVVHPGLAAGTKGEMRGAAKLVVFRRPFFRI